MNKFKLLEVSVREVDSLEWEEVYDIEVEDDHSYTLANGSIVHNCSDAAHGLGGHIIGDGGITCPGDLAKAFGAGADFCMLGSYLAGHDESEQVVTRSSDGDFIEFYGMSSETAQKKHGEGLKEYRASEGRVVRVPYKGSVNQTVMDLLGGLRSCCSYVGARTLKELPKRTAFILVSQQVSALYGLGKL